MAVNSLLSGHISPETAYVVDDYPYGFRLRCKIRYWLEYAPKKGVRLWSQTSNPKAAGLVWNKPKASTYSRFGGAMYLDEELHVQWSGLSEYMDTAKAVAWREQFGSVNHPEAVALADYYIKAKQTYDAKRADGLSVVTSAAIASGHQLSESSINEVNAASADLLFQNTLDK